MASPPRAAPITIVTSLFVVCCLATQSQERCTQNTNLRLTSPDQNSQSEADFLEVRVQDAWYRVCLHDVTTQTADVICSQLGFSHFRSLVSPPDGWRDDYWSDIAVQYSTLAACAGEEQCLSDCTGHQWQVVPFHGSTTSSIHPCYTQSSQLLLCETDDSTTINMELESDRIQKPIQTDDTQTPPSDSLLEEVNKLQDSSEQDQDDHENGSAQIPPDVIQYPDETVAPNILEHQPGHSEDRLPGSEDSSRVCHSKDRLPRAEDSSREDQAQVETHTELPTQDSITMSSLMNQDELIVPPRNQSFSDQPFLQADLASLFESPRDKSSDLTRTEEQYDTLRDAGKSGSRDMDKAQIPLGGVDPRQPEYLDWVLDDYEDYYLPEEDPNSLSNKIENALSEKNGLSSNHQNPDPPEEQTTESEPHGSSFYRDTENVITSVSSQMNVVTQTPAIIPDVILTHKETTPSYNSDTENVSNVHIETTEGEPDPYTTELVQKASMSTGQSFFDQSSIINTKPAQDMIGGEVTTRAGQQTPGENVAATTGIHLSYGEALMENIQTPSGSESFSSEKDTGYHQTNVTKTVDNNTDLKPWERKPESAEQRLDQMSTVSATSDEDVVHARTTPLPHTNDLTGVTIEDSDTEPMPIQTNNASDETDANTGKPTIATLFITQRGAIIGASERQTVQYDSANLKDATTSASELLETQSSKTATHTSHPHVEASESMEESVTSVSYSTSGYTEEMVVNRNRSPASESESAVTQSLANQTKPLTGSDSGHKEPMTHTEGPTDISTDSINEDQTNRPSPVDLLTEKQITPSFLEAIGSTTTSDTTASSSLVTQPESSASGYYQAQYTTINDQSNVTPAEESSATGTSDPARSSTTSTFPLDTATEPSDSVLDMNHDATTIYVPLQHDSDQKEHPTTTIDSVTNIELDRSTVKFPQEINTPANMTITGSSKPGENGFSSSSINGSSVQSGTTAAISQIGTTTIKQSDTSDVVGQIDTTTIRQSGSNDPLVEIDSTTIGQSDTHTAISHTDTTLTILRNTSNTLSEYETTTLFTDMSTTDDEFSDWNFDYEYYEFITGGGEKENIKDKGDSSNAGESDKGDSTNDEDPDMGDSTNDEDSDKGDSNNDKGEGEGKGVTLVNVQDKKDDSLAAEKEEEEENTTTMVTWPEIPEACLNLVTVTLSGPVNLSLPAGPGLSLPTGPRLSATRCRWRLVSQEDSILLSLSGHDPMTSVLTFHDVLTSENLTFPASESSEGSYKLVINSTEMVIEYRPVYSAVYTTVLLSVSTEMLPRPTVHGKQDGGHSVSDVVKVVLIVCTVLLILTVVITGACCFIKQARPTRRIRDMPTLINLERGFSDKRDPHGKPPNQNNKNKIGSRRSNTDNTSMSYENFSTTDCQSGAVNETTFSHQHHHHHPQYQPSAPPTDDFRESSASTHHSREIQPIRRSVSSEATNQQPASPLTDQSGITSVSKRTTGLGSNFNSRVLPEIEEITPLRMVPFSLSEPLRRSTPIVPFLGMMSTEIKDSLWGDEDTQNKLYDANTRGSVTQLDLDAPNSHHDAHTTQGSITRQDRMHTSHQAMEDGSKLGRWNEWNIPVYSGVGPLETGLKWSLETEAMGGDVGSADSGLNLDCMSNYHTGSRASIDSYSDTGSNDSVCSLHIGNDYDSGKHVSETMSIDSGSFEIDSKGDDSSLGKFRDSPVPHRIIKVRPYSATTTSINTHKNCNVKSRAASAGTNRNKKVKTMPEIFIKNKGGLYQSPKTTHHDLYKPCDNILVDQKSNTENVSTPPVYICPLSKQVMRVPVVAPDGMTYDKKALLDWHCKHGTSPLSGKPFNDLTLRVDFILLAKIREWKLKVKRENQQQGKIEIMADHPFGFEDGQG